MNTPLVSLIIPTCNRAAFLPATLASALSQDYPAKEIIVVDDGSTDNTSEICARHAVRYLRQENHGVSPARNIGVKHSRGELLVFLDDDDLLPPGSLRMRVDSWRRESCRHSMMGRLRRFNEQAPGRIEFIDPEESASHQMCMGAAMVARNAFEQLGGFDESLHMSEDADFWLRFQEAKMKLHTIPEICLYQRRHPGNATRDIGHTERKFLTVLHQAMQRRRRQSQTLQK